MYYCESDKPSIFLMKGYLKLRLQSLSFFTKIILLFLGFLNEFGLLKYDVI